MKADEQDTTVLGSDRRQAIGEIESLLGSGGTPALADSMFAQMIADGRVYYDGARQAFVMAAMTDSAWWALAVECDGPPRALVLIEGGAACGACCEAVTAIASEGDICDAIQQIEVNAAVGEAGICEAAGEPRCHWTQSHRWEAPRGA